MLRTERSAARMVRPPGSRKLSSTTHSEPPKIVANSYNSMTSKKKILYQCDFEHSSVAFEASDLADIVGYQAQHTDHFTAMNRGKPKYPALTNPSQGGTHSSGSSTS